jgi:hypothetical protein
MNALKGIYHNGMVELIEKPGIKGTAEVLVIFPEKKKKIAKIGGLFKGHKIDYAAVEKELKNSANSPRNIYWMRPENRA